MSLLASSRILLASAFLVALAACADAGADGSAGDPGPSGATVRSREEAEPPGARCAAGGRSVALGVDTDANGVLDDGEITSRVVVCDGAAGAAGDAGATGSPGDAGAAGIPLALGQFAPSQIVEGALVTCSSVTTTATTTKCTGIAVAGLPLRSGLAENTAVCLGITGKGVQVATSGSTAATYIAHGASGWQVATSGTAFQELTVTCLR